MATKKKTAAAERPAYPKNVGITGVLSFPLWNQQNLADLKEWRSEKGLPKPKFPETLGGTLFLTQPMLDKVKTYLLDEFLPFAEAMHEFDDSKGLAPDDLEAVTKKVQAEDWSIEDYVLPLRHLSEKDSENVDDDIVAKFVYKASGGNDITAKALARDEDNTLVLRDLDDIDNLPTTDLNEGLWWGSRNTFRGAFNLNAYTAAVTGITAYTRALYIRTDLPMTWGGNDDTEVLLEDDFE